MDNKPNAQMQIVMPEICAKCGIERAYSSWPIYSQYHYTFYVVAATYTTARFLVPVCDSCKETLDRDSHIWRNVFFICLVSMVVFLYLAYLLPNLFGFFVGLTFLAGIVFFCSIPKRVKYGTTSGIANFDGKHFIFFNKDFHHRFAELNPLYVENR